MNLNRRSFCAGLASAAGLAAGPAGAQPAGAPRLFEPRPVALALPGAARPVEAWGFDGATPGPLLRLRHGELVNLRLVNSLRAPLALHWQGVRIDNAFDGAPPLTGPATAPGATADLRFTPPDPGLFAYRPGLGAAAAEQLDRGLTGLLIVDEPAPPPVDHDVVAVVDDWRLGPDGAIRADFADPAIVRGAGRVGAIVTVNGRPAPETLAARPGARVRLRLCNAANARLLIVSFLGVRPFILAIDGQPCDPFEPVRQTVPVGPGARFDIAFEMPAAGAAGSIVARGATPPGLSALPDLPLVVLAPTGDPAPPRAEPIALPLNPALPPAIRLQDARRVELVLEGGAALPAGLGQALAMGYMPAAAGRPAAPPPWRLNGHAGEGLPAAPLVSVKRGTPVSMAFVNRTSFPQTMHVHGHVMRLLHPLDDGWEPYWRDSVIVPEGKTSRVAFLADNPGRWLVASTSPERQAAGLAAWFEVT
ncbi:MAG: multicopper oxidase family protein [Methylobacteriaceae bacterium]|nr:multicopper oxidase family protein [Methylobacteriaceae bacterium]